MPRYISFMLTQDQVRARTKTVTRRLGWKNLKPGTILIGAEKCQGLGKGGKIKKIATIRVKSVRQERLGRMIDELEYGFAETVAEGFPKPHPNFYPGTFVEFFCASHRGCTLSTIVTRIEFEYLDGVPA